MYHPQTIYPTVSPPRPPVPTTGAWPPSPRHNPQGHRHSPRCGGTERISIRDWPQRRQQRHVPHACHPHVRPTRHMILYCRMVPPLSPAKPVAGTPFRASAEGRQSTGCGRQNIHPAAVPPEASPRTAWPHTQIPIAAVSWHPSLHASASTPNRTGTTPPRNCREEDPRTQIDKAS